MSLLSHLLYVFSFLPNGVNIVKKNHLVLSVLNVLEDGLFRKHDYEVWHMSSHGRRVFSKVCILFIVKVSPSNELHVPFVDSTVQV